MILANLIPEFDFVFLSKFEKIPKINYFSKN